MSIFSVLSRDGVSESQFNQVLNVELDQIMEVILYIPHAEKFFPLFCVAFFYYVVLL